MPSYVIVGASRGIGYQFLKTLSKNPQNTVVGLARNPGAVLEKVSADKLPSNVHILPGDLTSPSSLSAAAKQVSQITGGAVDYLIVNGAYIPDATAFIPPSGFHGKEDLFLQELDMTIHTNVAGVLFSVNAFIELVKKSTMKKVIVLSTGLADLELTRASDLAIGVPYSLSKAATNILVAKCAIEYKSDGVYFLSLSPGLVQTAVEDPNNVPPEVAAAQSMLVEKVREMKPDFPGYLTPEQSVEMQLKVIEEAKMEDSGDFLSHHGNKDWL